MDDFSARRRREILEDAEAIRMLVDRWYEAELDVRNVIDGLGTDGELTAASKARDKAAAALIRSVSDLA